MWNEHCELSISTSTFIYQENETIKPDKFEIDKAALVDEIIS